MEQLKIIENKDWLTRRTGDPFADAGAYVIELMQKEYQNDSILQLIERAARIYVEDWKEKSVIFYVFPNSKMINVSIKGDRVKQIVEDFKQMFSGAYQGMVNGYCRVLGEKTQLFPVGKNRWILGASESYINFHHGHQSGLMLSKEVIIRMFFVPLGSVFIGGRIAVLSSNIRKVEEYFVRSYYEKAGKQIGQRNTEGGIRSDYKNPSSALFGFAEDCISETKRVSRNEKAEITLYHFYSPNKASDAKLSIYQMTNKVFEFYRTMMHEDYRKDWIRFAHSFFRVENGIYEPNSDSFKLIKGKKPLPQSFKIEWNPIYKNLIEEKSILRNFLEWVKKQQGSFEIFKIVKIYQTQIGKMKDETLDKIEELATYIVKHEDKTDKWLKELRNANPSQVRRVLVALLDHQMRQKEVVEKPLLSLREYARVLFSDGNSGWEIRDLLLISIYEQSARLGKPIVTDDDELDISKSELAED